MIYLVTAQQELYKHDDYKIINVEESLIMLKEWSPIQLDTETNGKDPHINSLLCVQFGNKKADSQIVVDCSTVDILLYKEILESKYLILQNAKFDLQFFYNYGIIPRKVYDTMIVEQLLYLGYPPYGKIGGISFSLKAIADRYLHIDIDKSVRGEIIWRGLDTDVIKYAAGDVTYLEDIADAQYNECVKKGCVKGAKLECDTVPAMAYLEWCGIKLDESRWKAKMAKDQEHLEERKVLLDKFVTDNPLYSKYSHVDTQGDLFSGFDLTPKCTINWDSSRQVIDFVKFLGFNTTVQDKKTGEDKDTVLEKELKNQQGINDEFLKLYFDYREASKVTSTYGQGHLDAINPITGRLHTTFKQLGAATGRMSSGGGSNKDLARYKYLKDVKYVNLQQLPSDVETRACFISEPDNLFVSCDFSAEESRLAADIYNDEEMRKEFTERTGDTHAMFAWAVFRKECEECGCKSALEVKKKAHQWRNKVKSVEFAYLFNAAAPTIAKSAGCTVEKAQEYIDSLDKFFTGRTEFKKRGSSFVRKNGYVLVSPVTGHKVYWWDFEEWKKRQQSFDSKFWDEYKLYHKGTGDSIAKEVKMHFQAASKYDRYALNSPTQGTGACIMKESMTRLFNYIVDNNYFNKIKICVVVHDEINCEYPKELTDFPNTLANIMQESAARFCKSLPIPAVPEVDTCWRH